MGAIRLFLALVVAADHWRVFILIPGGTGAAMSDQYKLGFNAGYAVMFFYVISGFPITYTLQRNYQPGTAGVLTFYGKRAARIFSLYWPLVLVAFVAIPGAWSAFAAFDAVHQLSAIFLIGLDWWRTAASPAEIIGLQQAWTLGAELTFYITAPWLMRSWKVAAALLVISLSYRLGFVLLHGPMLDDRWSYAFPVSTFCFFMAGHLICVASQRWKLLTSSWLAWPALVAAGAAMLWAGNYADFDGIRFWLSVPLFVLALPGVFNATKHIRWMNKVGDLSYPVYLVHLLPLILVAAMIVDVAAVFGSSPYTSVAVFLAVVIAAALVAHHLVERPVAHLMNRAVFGVENLRPANRAL